MNASCISKAKERMVCVDRVIAHGACVEDAPGKATVDSVDD